MWHMLCTRRFLIIAPQLFWTGISIAFFSGNLMEVIQATVDGSQEQKFEHANYAFILFGLGEILGCFFIGYIVDKFGSRPATYANIVIMAVMAGVTTLYCIVYQYGFLAFLMCFLWGFQDSAINTHSQEILGFEFNNNSEPFSVYNILQCLACSIFQIFQIWINTQTEYIIYSIFVGVLGILFAANTLRFQFREHERIDLITMKESTSEEVALD